MSRLKAIGHSPLTPLIGAALAAVGAAALIGFSLVAQVSLPEASDPDRAITRSSAGTNPGAIVLPTASPQGSGEVSGPLAGPAIGTGLIEPAAIVAPTSSGLDTTSPPVVTTPTGDGPTFRPSTRGNRGPTVAGPSRGDASDKKDHKGKGNRRWSDSTDDGGSWSPSASKGGSSSERSSKHVSKDKGPKHAPKDHDAKGKGKGHSKSKGKGHSKHRGH